MVKNLIPVFSTTIRPPIFHLLVSHRISAEIDCSSLMLSGLIFFSALSNVGQDFCQTLGKTFVKRWARLLSNVGQDLCQTLDKTFVKRVKYLFQALDNILAKGWTIRMYNVEQYPCA